MKLIIKILIGCIVIILIFFVWNEFSDLSLAKKINDQKVSYFFTAISSLLTAVTVFLLYKQITEQIEDRKASSRPDLYPENQFFTSHRNGSFPTLSREKKEDVLAGLISLHNIGLGAAKEIIVKWHFEKNVIKPLINSNMAEFYFKRETEHNYSFVSPNNKLEIQLPLMYLASLSSFKDGWTEMIWEELFLEISYKDINDYTCPTKLFKVTTYVGALYASFNFDRAKSLSLSNKSTIRSTVFIEKVE